MKILVVLSRVPWPLEKGDKLRAYHLIREWSKENEVTLFCLTDKPIDDKAEQKLNELCSKVEIHRLSKWGIMWRLMVNLFGTKPFQVAYFNSSRVKREFNRFLDQNIPDHIFCQLTRTAEYVAPYTVLSKSIDYMDAFSTGMNRMAKKAMWPKSWLMKVEAKRLKRYESQIQSLFDAKFIISQQDREQLAHVQDIKVIPNGIDPLFLEETHSSIDKTIDILFTGNMAYRPNIESAKMLVNEIMPHVWRKHPQTKVSLAGATPSNEVKQLGSDKVHVTGWIDDISKVYRSSKVFVAPMIVNTGLQNKLLEAMSCKVACITTSMANNALGGQPNKDLVIEDDPVAMANWIIDLLENQAMRDNLGLAGHDFVTQNFDWSINARLFHKAFKTCKKSVVSN